MKKICIECGTQILSSTYERTGGYCMPCSQTRQVNDEIHLFKLREKHRYIPKKGKVVYGKVYNIVAWVALVATIGVIVMAYTTVSSTLQAKSIAAVRRILSILSLFFLFHVWCSYKIGKIRVKDWVLEKSKSKSHFYTGIMIYIAIAVFMLWIVIVGRI